MKQISSESWVENDSQINLQIQEKVSNYFKWCLGW